MEKDSSFGRVDLCRYGERANDNYEMYSVESVEDSKRVYNAKPIAAVTFN